VESPTEEEGSRRYEAAEEAFLAAIRAEESAREVMTTLADQVATTAKAWNASAYAEYHAAQGDRRDELDCLTEKTELLEYLWYDIAGAFHGRAAVRDG